MAEDEEARCQGKDERFKILVRAVAGAADIGGGEEAEDILRRLGELPELEPRIHSQCAEVPEGVGSIA